MTNILFPMGVLAGAVNISLETLSTLAPQVAELLLRNNATPDSDLELYDLLEGVDIPPPKSRESVAAYFSTSFAGHPAVAFELNRFMEGVGIPLPLRSDAIKQLAIGFFLSQKNLLLEIEQIERGARDVYMAGYMLDLAVSGPRGVTHPSDLVKQATSTLESFDRLIANLGNLAEESPDGYDDAYGGLVCSLLKESGRNDRAFGMLDRIVAAACKIKQPGGRSLALVQITDDLIDAGLNDRTEKPLEEAATAAFQNTEDLDARGEDLRKISSHWIKFGNPDRAREIAEKMVSCARNMEPPLHPADRSYDLGIAAWILKKAGFTDLSREIFEEAVAVIPQIIEHTERRRAQESLVESLKEADFSNLAEKVRAEITPQNTRR